MANARPKRRKRTNGAKPRVASTADAVLRASEGMVRGERDRVRDGRSAAVREVHDGPRTNGSQRRRADNRTNGEGDLRPVRGDRGSKGQAADQDRQGSTGRRRSTPTRTSLAAAAAQGFVDRKGRELERGCPVRFHSYRGTVMTAVVEADRNAGTMVLVRIGKDPFPTYVDHRQVERVGRGKTSKERTTMARTKPATPVTRELRQKARDLALPNWEVMDRDELLAAVSEHEADSEDEESEEDEDDTTEDTEDDESEDETEEEPTVATTSKRTKSAARKAPASKRAPAKKKTATKKPAARAKTTTKRAAPRPPSQPEGPNPFRVGSNLHAITEELMKGGKRSTLVKRLLPKLEYKPRVKDTKSFDPTVETDRRLKIVGYLLRQQYGFEYEHGGHGGPERGPDAYIKVTPPS